VTAGEMSQATSSLRRLESLCPGALVDTRERFGEATAVVESDRLIEVLQALRDDEVLAFEMLADLTAVDRLGREPRFEVVYHLLSVSKHQRIRIVVPIAEAACVLPSVVGLWPAANWLEREVWDLYGIRFDRHPDLRRILLYEEFEGHPLRKDYPKTRRQPLIGGEPGEVGAGRKGEGG